MQIAREEYLYSDPLTSVQRQVKSSQPTTIKVESPSYQAVFCIDDRECSLRRHLETTLPGVKTFGAAGFFGLDIRYKGIGDEFALQQCPIILQPKYTISEDALDAAESDRFRALRKRKHVLLL